MKVQKMRDALKDVVEVVPRKNEKVIELYNEKFGDKEDAGDTVVSIVKNDNMYTYIGSGDEPPHMIDYMGLQRFIRGELTEVTNEIVLSKIAGNKCFVKGAYDKDKLFENDKDAKKKVESQREEDLKTQIYMERQNRK